MLLSFLTTHADLAQKHSQLKTTTIVFTLILILFLAATIAFIAIAAQKKSSRKRRRTQRRLLRFMYAAIFLVLICMVVSIIRLGIVGKKLNNLDDDRTHSRPSASTPTTDNTDNIIQERPDKAILEKWGLQWEIIQNGSFVDNYNPEQSISFGSPEDYFALPGISTFRGNNYRNSATYGTANVVEKDLEKAWMKNNVGSLNGWPGIGWTGQPLIVQWPESTKAVMNLYDSKKAKEGLVEVIYATLDGHIYFYDLEDGSFTRNAINVGMNFKGAGSLDPRGYPIMYVGSGDYIETQDKDNPIVPKMYIISLIDGSILYEQTGADSFSTRKDWAAFDSAPLIDKETDTLIWPGESGILYTIKLNTKYDEKAGTLSINPEELVKTWYTTERSNDDTYWIGYEPSAVIVDRYLYISENGGMFFCINLDTMRLEWAQDTRDDSNSTPVFEWAGTDIGYIYTAPSLHWTATDGKGYICIYKLNAKTGDIVWEKRFDCYTVEGVSGGVQSSPLLGKPGTQLDGLIIYTIARTPGIGNGKIVAINTQTGETVWEKDMDYYAWSSPVAVYTDSGEGYVLYGDSAGNLFMVDHTGKTLSRINLGSNIEASPAVYNDTLVIGTRGGRVYGIKIK